ncbi:MAG: hypothetical protein ABIC95_07325 [archaeon]
MNRKTIDWTVSTHRKNDGTQWLDTYAGNITQAGLDMEYAINFKKPYLELAQLTEQDEFCENVGLDVKIDGKSVDATDELKVFVVSLIYPHIGQLQERFGPGGTPYEGYLDGSYFDPETGAVMGSGDMASMVEDLGIMVAAAENPNHFARVISNLWSDMHLALQDTYAVPQSPEMDAILKLYAT